MFKGFTWGKKGTKNLKSEALISLSDKMESQETLWIVSGIGNKLQV